MIDQDETARDILDDLIDEIDNAGAVLASTVDCTTQRGMFAAFATSISASLSLSAELSKG